MFTNNLLFGSHDSNGGLGVAHQVPHFDSLIVGGGNPLSLGVEGQLGDLSFQVELSGELIHAGHIPDSDHLSGSGSGDVLSIGGDAQTVHVLIMMLEAASDLEVGVPYLDSAIPSY